MAATERDKAVWSAYIGSALALKQVQDNPDVAQALAKAQAQAAAGKTTGLAKALTALLDDIAPVGTDHPSRQHRARAATANVTFVIEAVSGRADSAEPDDTTSEEPAGDGKVDCPCGKRHAEGSKVLAKHQAAAE